MIRGTVLFDIPVYRTDEQTFYADQRRRIDERVRKAVEHGAERRWAEHVASGAEQAHGWPFNEVVGWVRLYVDGDVAKADLWWSNAKRFNRNFHLGTLYESHKVLEFWPRNETNEEIASELRRQLVDASRRKSIKRYHMDLTLFDTLSPFVDWRRLLQLRD
jgi:hypothetical protein